MNLIIIIICKTNLNAFFILIAIGFSLHFYKNSNKEDEELKDKKNSPIQLISQLRGYFFKNAFLSLSFAITIFSFAGIPPLIGFFSKQFVLYSALDQGYYLLSIIAIIVSVISASYYLKIIKIIHLDNNSVQNESVDTAFAAHSTTQDNNILSSFHSFIISSLSLFILFFILILII